RGPSPQQGIPQIRAKNPCAAGHQHMHSCDSSMKTGPRITAANPGLAGRDGYSVLPQTGALVCDDALQSFFQGQARTVADELGQCADVWDPPPYIFEALLIGRSVGDENNLRIRAGHALDAYCQFADSD